MSARPQLFQDKFVFITGVARGQGRDHAVRFSAEGARIIGVDRCEDLPHTPYPLASEEDLAETVRQVEAAGGAMRGGGRRARPAALRQAVRDGIDGSGGST